MKKIIRNIIILILVAATVFAGYKQLESNKQKIESDAQLSSKRNEIIPVITQQVGMAEHNNRFEVVGSFAPYKQVALMSEAAGKAVQVNFENGDYVKAGSRLLKIDNDLLKIQQKSLEANLAKAKNDLQRLKNLLGEGGVTQAQVEEAELAIVNLEAQVESNEKQIAMTYVTAPISGIISSKMVEPGTLVAPSMQVATITNINRLKMQVFLTEEQVVQFKKGDQVELATDLFPDKIMKGNITFIDVMANTSRRYLVEVEVQNPGNQLKAGMSGTVYFSGKTEDAMLAVPRECIVGNLRDAKVYVVESGRAKLKNVKTGIIFGNLIQIREGLQEGETIVVSGQINLEDGMAITTEANGIKAVN